MWSSTEASEATVAQERTIDTMPTDESLNYPIEYMHGAAQQITQDTNDALDRHHEHHRRAQDALGRLPGHLQQALGQLLASTHEYCLRTYDKHHSVATSLHATATAMSGLDVSTSKPFEHDTGKG